MPELSPKPDSTGGANQKKMENPYFDYNLSIFSIPLGYIFRQDC
jgi:hypothetical protein